jgi:glycosyltransferase involved in cell wall biosynthesis
MRIMVVTPKVANGSLGGAEYLVWGLSRSLAARGHRVEVFTTCSSHSISTRPGYLIWNNHFKEGAEKTEGVVVHRFPVRNNWPAFARQARLRMDRQLEKEDGVEGFASQLAGLLEPGGTCLVSGWHQAEEWKDGPARWTSREARVAMRDSGVGGIRMRVFSPLDQELELDAGPGANCVVSLQAGEERQVELGLEPRGSLVLRLRAGRVFKPPIDLRELGVAVRGMTRLRGAEEVEVDLEADLGRFLETGPEEAVFSLLAGTAEARPEKYQRDQVKVIGPCSPGLERAVGREVPGFDAVIATHSPHATLGMACEAARASGIPCIALPLFHPRDRYQYWPGILRHLRGATRVDASSPTLAGILSGLGTSTFAAGVGLDPGEFERVGDPGEFRRKYSLPEVPLLLWVGRKNARKGYLDAVEAVRCLHERGQQALLVMVGLDDDGKPVPGREAVYLGPLERSELVRAYACASALILPSRDESFGVTLCEAWMAGKPVIGWERCSATRDLVVHGENGFLCAGVEELADAAATLLADPGLAESMGRKGRGMVVENFTWEKVAEQYEREIVQMRKDGR